MIITKILNKHTFELDNETSLQKIAGHPAHDSKKFIAIHPVGSLRGEKNTCRLLTGL